MLRIHTCLSVHCDQCGDGLCSSGFAAHYRSERAALAAATASRWQSAPDGRLLCSACAPVLACEVEGHQFSEWRDPVLRGGLVAMSEYRYCRRCCEVDSRPAAVEGRGGEPR